MSRNSSGTYTLPTGNPVVSGTVIEANWANNTLDDISAALTDSLSRSGKGSMSAALRIIDGSVTVPGWAFANETGSGAYRSAAGDWYLTVLGSNIARLRASGMDVTGNLGINGQTLTLENSTAYYPQILNRNTTNDANGSYILVQKNRNGAVVQNGDVLGNFVFQGYDGTQYLQGAYVNAVVSAAPGTNDMPTDLVFGTTPDGSAGPTERMRITNGGDVFVRGGKGVAWYDGTNSGYWAQYNSGGNLIFSNGTERMRSDSSGKLGIGMAPLAGNIALLQVANSTSIGNTYIDSQAAEINANASGNRYAIVDLHSDDTYTDFGMRLVKEPGANADGGIVKRGTGKLYFSNSELGLIEFSTNGSRRAVIPAGGGLCVNADTFPSGIGASANDTYTAGLFIPGTGYKCKAGASGGYSNTFNLYWTSTAMQLWVDGVSLGNITVSSDHRIKRNIQTQTQPALERVMQLRPVTYQRAAYGDLFKESDDIKEGFIAHELAEVIPSAVEGEKDAENQIQSLKLDAVVSVLAKAIQELKAEVDALKAAAK